MTYTGRYLAGVAAVGAAGLGLVAGAPPVWQPGMAWGLLAGMVLQAPLGWWTLRAIGTARFLAMWGLGMLVRLAVVAIAALVQIPALGDAATPMLATMVGVLVALLLIEGVVAMREQSREDRR